MEYAERGEVEQKIYQFMSQSFMRLDVGDQMLMRRFGLTLTQSWALVHLEQPEGRSLTELASLLICDKSNVTAIVDKLEEEELAVRKRGKAGDRRYTRVVLTERGHQLRRAVIAAREHMVRERLHSISGHDLYQLYDSLQKLRNTLVTQYEDDEETRIIEHAFAQNCLPSLVKEL
jgi:DNA-binding MarR family transcriptional regulator